MPDQVSYISRDTGYNVRTPVKHNLKECMMSEKNLEVHGIREGQKATT